MSGWPITATGPDSGVSTPSLIVVPSKPGPLLTSAAPPSPSDSPSSAAPPHPASTSASTATIQNSLFMSPSSRDQYENGHALK